jgi:4-aminobutyrate aminotransferase-like enzyme
MEFIVPGEGKKANPEAAGRVLDECYRRGLIAYTAGAHGQVVRMMPPLILTEAQADEALSILNESLAAASKAA